MKLSDTALLAPTPLAASGKSEDHRSSLVEYCLLLVLLAVICLLAMNYLGESTNGTDQQRRLGGRGPLMARIRWPLSPP